MIGKKTFIGAWLYCALALVLFLMAACGGAPATPTTPAEQPTSAPVGEEPAIPEIPSVTVRFGSSQFVDHSQAFIAIEKGWFEEVGIALEHDTTVKPPDPPGLLSSGALDVVSSSAVFSLPALQQFPDIRMFAIADVFWGWGVSGPDDPSLKSYADFVAEGASHEEALQNTMQQLAGKRWVHPSFPAPTRAVNVLLELGGVPRDSVESITVEDNSQLVPIMRTGQADFFLGDAPSRAALETEGFKTILSVGDVIKHSEASADAPAMHLAFYDGWLTSVGYWESNRDTVLRMASVCWRISDFINTNTDEALAIHIPALNSISGRELTEAEGRKIYEELDPFLTFEDQEPIFTDPGSPLYFEYELLARIASLEAAGVVQPGELTPASVTIADQVYMVMAEFKEQTEALLDQLEPVAGDESTMAGQLFAKARTFYEARNYLDSVRFAEAALEWAKYEGLMS